MYHFHSTISSTMRVRGVITALALLFIFAAAPAQEQFTSPTWWYGAAGGVNLNFYGGTTQMLNSGLSVPTAFHKGFGAGIYLAPVLEYRPNTMWGGILQLGYDDRRASFFDVPCPCGENSSLTATVSYISFEPSLRFSPFEDEFFIFGGPRIGYNFSFSSPDEKRFLFVHEGKFTTQGEFSDMNSLVYSGQIGIGYDIALSASDAETQWELSPFVSFQPYFGQAVRSSETWGVSTIRAGVSLKFGSGDENVRVEEPKAVVIKENDVPFTVRAPKVVPVKRRVRESFPVRNYVFFDEGSAAIPMRYEKLSKADAATFKEEQLQEVQPKNNTGRSLRQMTVYYNILNVTGDRMKRNPGTTVFLSGSSTKGAAHGKERAETVKNYLVTVFGIDSGRITTEGREKPRVQSEIIGGTKELTLIREGDNRVDIESASPELMLQVGGVAHPVLKPVQIIAVVEDPLDSHLMFNAPGAKETFSSWSIEVIDSAGKVQRFGPSTKDRMTVPGNKILGGRSHGDYTVVMLAQTKNGASVRKETTVHLIRRDEPKKEAIRYSILFDFDKSKTAASYEKFLTEIVVPQIPDSGIVVIQGFTDIIGEEEYNENLSRERAEGTQTIIENALPKNKKRSVTFETIGFGEESQYAPFDNYYPEQRFYNRSVIIDIVPD